MPVTFYTFDDGAKAALTWQRSAMTVDSFAEEARERRDLAQ